MTYDHIGMLNKMFGNINQQQALLNIIEQIKQNKCKWIKKFNQSLSAAVINYHEIHRL